MTYVASAEICVVLPLSWGQALTEAFFVCQLSLDTPVLRERHPLTASSVQHTHALVKQCNCEWEGRRGEEKGEQRIADHGARSGGH